MLSVTPFKSYTASLVGMAPRATSPAGVPAAATTPPSVPPAVPPPRVASTPSPTGYEAYKDPDFVRDPSAAIARSEAAFARWDAGEVAFEAANGFRHKVNSMALGAYAKAQSGNFGVPAFASADRAAEYAEYIVSSMRSNASTIRINTVLADSLARPDVAAHHGEKRTAQMNAEYADGRKAAEMDLFVLNAVLTRAFGLSGPVTRQDGGTVSFVAQDIAWNGRSLVRLSEDGVLTPLDPDGQPASVDQRA
jgi:hypothetical protein